MASNETMSLFTTAMTTDYNTNNSLPDDKLTKEIIFLYAGCCISIFFILVALITYTTNRYIRVKRQHMISINLFVSLLIFYMGFLLSLVFGDHSSQSNASLTYPSPGCITSAVFICAGWFFIMLWTLVDWIYLCFTIHQRVSRHISYFFLKSTLPTYGLGILLAIIFVIIDAGHHDISFVSSQYCWYELRGPMQTLFFLITTLLTVAIIGCAIFCCVKFTFKANKNTVVTRMKKNKRTLIRLTMITFVVFTTSVGVLSYWIVKIRDGQTSYEWLTMLVGFLISIEGFAIVLCVAFRTDEFYSYWTAVLKGRNPTTVRSFKMSNHNIKSINNKSVKPPGNDVTPEEAQNERPVARYEPRDQNMLQLTTDDEVFFNSPKTKSPVSSPKKKQNLESVKSDSGSGTLNRINSIKKRLSRNAKRSKKSSATSTPSLTTPPTTPPSSATMTLNRFNFNRESTISMTLEHERKTSF